VDEGLGGDGAGIMCVQEVPPNHFQVRWVESGNAWASLEFVWMGVGSMHNLTALGW
jgi:hypothetical protein